MIGLTLPIDRWLDVGWPGVLLAGMILILRRLPWLLLVHRGMPSLPQRSDILFAGWFGPIGVSAVLYALVVVDRTGLDEVWTIASVVVCASIVAHGISALPLMKWYRSVTDG